MLERLLRRSIREGELTVTMPGGQRLQVAGAPSDALRPVSVRLRGALTPLRLAYDAERYLGEAYMDGTLVMQQGSVYDLLALGVRNLAITPWAPPTLLQRAVVHLTAAIQQNNTRARARRNVAHHYDLSNDLYRLFLDEDMQYSCAYFTEPGATLDAAQAAKKRHIAAKLLLSPGQRVLDIGCGWGGLAISLAREADVEVLGITLSTEQLALARARAAALGLGDRVRFELADYRTLEGRFDRIVSVGMFEHVGSPHYPDYFRAVSRLLAPRGVALIHAIGNLRGRGRPNPWLAKYIFPGGYVPSLSEVIPPIEGSGLWLADLEILRLHYAETLRHWRERFMARSAELPARYDDRFKRMWEFYLACCEALFRFERVMVFQAQLSHAVDAVPITRDYVAERERALGDRVMRAAE